MWVSGTGLLTGTFAQDYLMIPATKGEISIRWGEFCRMEQGKIVEVYFLLDLIDKGITGKDADAALGKANITVNKNAVPNDPQSPFVTSGIRVGTPAATTRGFGLEEVTALAGWMCDIIDSRGDQAVIDRVRGQVLEVCRRLPVYAG